VVVRTFDESLERDCTGVASLEGLLKKTWCKFQVGGESLRKEYLE
jgi:hypothetical protein